MPLPDEEPATKSTIAKDIVLPVTLVLSMVGAAFAGGLFTSDVKNRMTSMEAQFHSNLELFGAKMEAELAALKGQLLLLTEEVQASGKDRWTGNDMRRYGERLAEALEPWASQVMAALDGLAADSVGPLTIPKPSGPN